MKVPNLPYDWFSWPSIRCNLRDLLLSTEEIRKCPSYVLAVVEAQNAPWAYRVPQLCLQTNPHAFIKHQFLINIVLRVPVVIRDPSHDPEYYMGSTHLFLPSKVWFGLHSAIFKWKIWIFQTLSFPVLSVISLTLSCVYIYIYMYIHIKSIVYQPSPKATGNWKEPPVFPKVCLHLCIWWSTICATLHRQGWCFLARNRDI